MLAKLGLLLMVACVAVATHQRRGRRPDGGDEIVSLPGLSKMTSFKQYSGYLDASDTKKFHYWFVESQGDAKKDPLVLWLNGGPGCSSLDGLLSENGPLLINNDGETLRTNPYSWNKIANVLYLESPAGVGYSYDTTGKVATNNEEVATNNYNALVSFMGKYPEYKGRALFVSGESYAGVYLPMLALKLQHDTAFNFKGMLVGNGLSSDDMNTNSLIFFAYYHGLFADELWTPMTSACCKSNNITADNCNFVGQHANDCGDYVAEALQYVYNIGLNSYSLYMDCEGGSDAGFVRRYAFDMAHVMKRKSIKQLIKQLPRAPNQRRAYGGGKLGETPPCINSTASTNWLNKQDVRDAINIPDRLPQWAVCSEDVGNSYERIDNDLTGTYQQLLKRNGFRVLIYNGDTDMACNFMGDEWFVDRLPDVAAYRARTAWYVQGQVAGFHKMIKSTTASAATLHYTTIRGAGHMVPQWAPQYSYAMFSNFLNDVKFQDWDSN